MGANSFVMETVTSGYKIPFLHTTKTASFKNNKSALQNKLFVTESIAELLRGGKSKENGQPHSRKSVIRFRQRREKAFNSRFAIGQRPRLEGAR